MNRSIAYCHSVLFCYDDGPKGVDFSLFGRRWKFRPDISLFTWPSEVMNHHKKLADLAYEELRLTRSNAFAGAET